MFPDFSEKHDQKMAAPSQIIAHGDFLHCNSIYRRLISLVTDGLGAHHDVASNGFTLRLPASASLVAEAIVCTTGVPA